MKFIPAMKMILRTKHITDHINTTDPIIIKVVVAAAVHCQIFKYVFYPNFKWCKTRFMPQGQHITSREKVNFLNSTSQK
jgi:hypothetical protein